MLLAKNIWNTFKTLYISSWKIFKKFSSALYMIYRCVFIIHRMLKHSSIKCIAEFENAFSAIYANEWKYTLYPLYIPVYDVQNLYTPSDMQKKKNVISYDSGLSNAAPFQRFALIKYFRSTIPLYRRHSLISLIFY